MISSVDKMKLFLLVLLCLINYAKGEEGLRDKIEDIMMATASNYTYDLTPSESELLIAEANLNELNKTRMLLIVSNEKLLDRLMLLLSDAMTVSEKVPRETNNFINKTLKQHMKDFGRRFIDTNVYANIIQEFNELPESDQKIVNQLFPDLLNTINTVYLTNLLSKIRDHI